jgi:aspartate beta-hydroxylase
MSENPAGLNQAAMQALGAGDFATAQALLQRLVTADPSSIPGWLNLAAVRRRLNDANGAFDALREVLRRDPRNFPALLMSATLLERQGDMKGAAGAYGAALANAPPDNYLDRPTQQAVTHAREVHGRHTRELQEFIRARVGDVKRQ